MFRSYPTLAVAGLIGLGAAHSASDVSAAMYEHEYTEGHADIRLLFEDNELNMYYRFDSSAVIDGTSPPFSDIWWYEPDSLYVRAPDSTATDLPPGFLSTPYGFIGAPGDADSDPDDVWILPQGSVPGQPYFGFATEELGLSEWSPITFNLVAVAGPGEFSLWQTDSFGGPIEFFDTYDGGLGTAEDDLVLPIGTHAHYNWGFTAPGLYYVTITATGTHTTLGQFSDTETFVFAVGDATVVPEPASLGLLALGGAMCLCRRFPHLQG